MDNTVKVALSPLTYKNNWKSWLGFFRLKENSVNTYGNQFMTNTGELVTDLKRMNKENYFRRTYETHKGRNFKCVTRYQRYL